jgi:ABC-type glycerol-3-phosphate transport system substrate-binding protein
MKMKFRGCSLLLFLLAVVLAACGKSENEGNTEGKLIVWVHADINKQYYDAVAERFKEDHPDVEVEVVLMDTTSISDKYTVIMNSGGTGAPDLLDVEQGIFPNFIRGEVPFAALNDLLKADGLSEAIAEGRQALYTVDGQVYGLEAAATVSALYYRKDIYDAAGIDVAKLKTWDEFMEASKKLADEDTFILPGGNPSLLNQFEMLLRQEGGDIVTADGGIGINTPEGLAVMNRLHQWRQQGLMDEESPEGPAYWEAFVNGRYIATYGPDWWANLLVDQAPDMSGLWAAVPMPLGGPNSVNTTVWGGTGLAISKFTKNKDLAWEFMKLASLDPDMVEQSFLIRNQFPALLTALDKPGLQSQSKYTEFFGGQNLGELYGSLLEDAPNQNQAWWRPLTNQAWEQFLFDYLEGKLEPEQFLANVQAELEARIAAEEAKRK